MRIDLRLAREITSDQGTFGSLEGPGLFVRTCELPWRNNEPNVSSIPAGTYELRPRRYNRGGYDAIEVLAVQGRSHILIHVGNTTNDILGCICVGRDYGVVEGRWAVITSKSAFGELMRLFEEWTDKGWCVRLNIENNYKSVIRKDPALTA